MFLTIGTEHWNAEVFCSEQPTDLGFWSVEARIDADSNEEGLSAAKLFLDLFAKGRFALIRAKPEAITERDFDTKKTLHRAFVRFAFKLEPGEWQYRDNSVPALPSMAYIAYN